MRTIRRIAIVGFTALGLSNAQAATIIPVVPPVGAMDMFVTGINDNNVIAGGYYTSDGIEHGFFGPLDGSNYTTFDYGTQWTEARGINNDGEIIGFYNSEDPNTLVGNQFERFTDGTIKTVKHRKALLDGLVESINSKGVFVGDNWDDSTSTVSGYYGKKAKYLGDVVPGTTGTSIRARGINDTPDMVGYLTNSHLHGFLIHDGVTTVIDFPGARDTRLEAINNKGVITGYWSPDGSAFHAFYYDQKKSVFSQIDVSGSSFTTAFGINKDGLVLINSDFGFYVFCPKAPNKCPGGGTVVADPKLIHVAARSFLRFGDKRETPMVPEKPGRHDGEGPKR